MWLVKLSFRGALATLLTGVLLFAANIYLDGSHHRVLANICFGLAVMCEIVFVVFVFIYVFSKSWTAQTEQKQQMTRGPVMKPGQPGQPGPPPMHTQTIVTKPPQQPPAG